MAVRINKAKNFKGKSYVAADELDNLIRTLSFTNTGSAITGDATGVWKVSFTKSDTDDSQAASQTLDLTAIKNYIDNKSITVSAGNGIAIDDTNKLSPTIAADIDGTTIVFTGSTEGSKVLSNGIKLIKKTTANTGYAASYALADKDGNAINGSVDIDIVKDKFLKSGAIVYGKDDGTTPAGDSTTEQSAKTTGFTVPWLKLVLHVNENGVSEDDTVDTTLYMNMNDLFDSYEAGNSAINATELAANKITVVVDGTNKVYTATATTGASILTIGNNGIEVADIQGAINYAVKNEHEKASAAITSTNANITSLANATSTVVTALNTRIEAVATSAQAGIQKVGSAVDILDTQVSAAIADVNTNVETAIDSVVTNANAAINTNITNINTSVAAAIATVNAKVDSAVDSVNAQVTSLANATSNTVTALNTNITSFEATVSTTINNVQTAVTNFANATSTALTSAIDNRSTQLTNAVQVLEETVTVEAELGNTGNYGATVTAVHILAVYDNDGNEIYPDIHRGSTISLDPQASPTYYYSVTANYGTDETPSESERTWTIVYTMPLPALGATTMPAYTAGSNTVAYEDVTNSVEYSNADKGTDASYTNVTKTDVVAVDADDVTWSDVADVKATAVGNGTPAEGPAVPTEISKAVPDYAGYSNGN